MPKRPLPHSFADAYAATAQTLMRQVGDTMAAEAGPPTSVEVEGVTERQRAAGWNTAHPEATDAAMWQLAQRKYAEHAQAAAAGKMNPEDVVAAVAEDLTHFRYRARQGLYTLGTTSWAEQVKEASRLAKLAARAAPPTTPEPAPPGMPALSEPPTPPPDAAPAPPGGAPAGPPTTEPTPPPPGAPPAPQPAY
ncbi:MAG: hypothetical protein ACJ780_17595 [Solirubrobacteraceae bacterium]